MENPLHLEHILKDKINENLRLICCKIEENNFRKSKFGATVDKLSLVKRIYELMSSVKQSLESGQKPLMKYMVHDWSNCLFEESGSINTREQQKYSHVKSRKDVLLIIQVLGKILRLLSRNSTVTKREFFYQNLQLFRSYNKLDKIMNKICGAVLVPQWELGILTMSKGLVAGSLSMKCKSETVICSIQHVNIPREISSGAILQSSAKFILIVEKDSAMQKLLNEDFIKVHGPCIIVTGRGYPDINTKILIQLCWEQLKIPIFALTDGDPYGIEIACIYRFGLMKQLDVSNTSALPSIIWIGVYPSDIPDYYVKFQQMTERDLNRAQRMLTRPYIISNPKLCDQIKLMITMNLKTEIEGVATISNSYLTDIYIPMRLSSQTLIELK